MARKPSKKPKPKGKIDDPEEYKRFLEAAEEVGASDNPKAFDKAFKRIVMPRKS